MRALLFCALLGLAAATCPCANCPTAPGPHGGACCHGNKQCEQTNWVPPGSSAPGTQCTAAYGTWCPWTPPGRCGYACTDSDCGKCVSFSSSAYCQASKTNCERDCKGTFCPNGDDAEAPKAAPKAAPKTASKSGIKQALKTLKALRANATKTALSTPSNNLYCSACTELAGQLEGKGCGLACDAIPPPGDAICGWILDMTDLCSELVQALTGGETPTQACTDIGMCGSECECGVCTRTAAGDNGRCLGMPNDCGNTVHVPAWAKKVVAGNSSNFCLDGQCDGTNSNYGCCLTCF